MEHRHFKINKPAGMISQFINNKTRKKRVLGELYEFPEETMPIGRLDKDTEGLLLLTTDGKESEKVRSKSIEKEYWAQVDGIVTEDAIRQLEEGVVLSHKGSGYKTMPAKVKVVDDISSLPTTDFKIRSDRHGPTSWLSITISEGKYKQVRKMTAVVGFPTLRLVRVRIGKLTLGKLKLGEVVELNELTV
jgi:23S rRNA pseudouridine2457 synthase